MKGTALNTSTTARSRDPLERSGSDAGLAANDRLQSAFRLAYFIHPDRELAIQIVKEAMEDLEAARTTQRRRLYYTPNGFSRDCAKPQTPRTKVVMADAHLLQRLVFRASESYEIQQERESGRRLTEEDMLIRFVKHLVRITVRRSSFYVALGISRLLHGYSTAETIEIYTAVMQDPGRTKEESYYRACKRELMSELEERFGKFLRRVRGPRGEERFAEEASGSRHSMLVRECLSMFTPWETSCVGAVGFDGVGDELSHLAFDGDEPDTEHPIEMNRMHAITHPECYGRVAAALELEQPESRLSLPRFQIGQSNDRRPPVDRHRPPGLSEEELNGLLGELELKAKRRRRISARHLSVLVDGIRVGQLDSAKGDRLRLELGEGSELMEVRARDREGEVKLASLPLSWRGRREGERTEDTILAEGGKKITFSVSYGWGQYGEACDGVVEVAYEEANSVRAAWQELREAVQTTRAESRLSGIKDVSRNRTPLLGMRARGDEQVLRLAEKRPMDYAELSETLIRGAVSTAVLTRMADKLVTLAEHARTFRRLDDLEELGWLLITLPLSRKYQEIGYYYLALSTANFYGLPAGRSGEDDSERTARLFERVAETAPPEYRVRAVQCLGASAANHMKFDFALKLYAEADRLASRERVFDPAGTVARQCDVAIIRALDGDHRQALTMFDNLLPLAQTIRASRPRVYYNFLNGLAVELGAAGRLDEAERVCRTVLRSPLASAYPVYHETSKDLEHLRGHQASRSQIALGR